MYFGNVCQTGLPSLARPGMMGGPQPSPEPKPRLPFQLLPAFSEMDHIHKALIGPGFRLATPLKRKSSSCGVCRLRFNSEVQASSHYGGTKHAKRIKALDSPVDTRTNSPETTLLLAKDTMSPPAPPLLLHLSPPAPPASSSSSSSDTSSAGVEVSATSPPASEACSPPSGPALTAAETTQDHAPPDGPPGGEPSSLPPSGPGAEKEKEKEMETDRDGEEAEEEPEALETESEEEKARRLLYCSLCKVAVNSASQLQAHNSGTKHKTMLEARSGDGAIKSFPRSGVKAKLVAAAVPPEASTGLQNKTFHCEICDVHVNSETQLKQHISSRRHKDRAAGKPAKPKFSPYAPPPHRLQSMQAVRLALRKDQDLTKQPLASCSLLQRHLAAAAAAAMTSLSPFHLRPAPSNTGPALFHQTQPSLTHQALLHHHHHPPPPASTTPICSALNHTPVLFSPY